MKLDREFQRTILEKLTQVHPRDASATFDELESMTDEDTLVSNLLYLEEHGLIVSGVTPTSDDDFLFVTSKLRVTAKGMDFLADDGGLTAILGVVTVRLHDDTIKDLIEAKILAADLPQPDKRKYLDALRELPAESTKHLVMKLIDLGLANASSAWPAIQNALSVAL